MSRLTRDGTAEPVLRDQILRHVRGQGDVHFRCSADHEQDWQPYPVDPYSAICDDRTYIHTRQTVTVLGVSTSLNTDNAGKTADFLWYRVFYTRMSPEHGHTHSHTCYMGYCTDST